MHFQHAIFWQPGATPKFHICGHNKKKFLCQSYFQSNIVV